VAIDLQHTETARTATESTAAVAEATAATARKITERSDCSCVRFTGTRTQMQSRTTLVPTRLRLAEGSLSRCPNT
jgi:hypothetical protein